MQAESGSSGQTLGKEVAIRIGGQLASVELGLAHLLAPMLGYAERAYRPGGPRGWESRTVLKPLSRVEPDGRLVTFAGMVPRMRKFLERLGYKVEVVDLTPPDPRHRPDGGFAACLRGGAVALARALMQHRRGLIEVAGRGRLVAYLDLIVRLFPAARVWVVAARRAEARRLHRLLRRRLRRPVALLRGGLYYVDRTPIKVVISTRGSFDPDQAIVIVFPDAREAAADGMIAEMAQVVGQRVYGFVAPGATFGRRDAARLEGHFGPVIHSASCRGAAAGVRVVVADAPLGHAADHLHDGLDYKRRAVWHNDRRNAAVAEVAGALAAGQLEPLWRHGLFLDGADDPPLGAPRPRVAVLVESPEHGRALARRLPGWPLLEGPGGADGTRLPDRAIVTLVHARRRTRLDVDALVRADGTAWPLELPGFPPRPRGRAEEILLVDFADEGDAVAAAATRCRLHAYVRLGWRVEGSGRLTGGAGMVGPERSGAHLQGAGPGAGPATRRETTS